MKKITILLIMAIVCQVCANAQSPKAFTAVLGTKEIGTGVRLMPAKNHLFIGHFNALFSIDSNYKLFQHKYTDPANPWFSDPSFISYNLQSTSGIYHILHLKDNIFWGSGRFGFVEFEESEETDSINFLSAYSNYNVQYFTNGWEKRYDNSDAAEMEIYSFCFDTAKGYVYYMTLPGGKPDNCLASGDGYVDVILNRMKINNPASSESVVCRMSKFFHSMGLSIIMDKKGVIWVSSGNDNGMATGSSIYTYNTNTNEFKAYDREKELLLKDAPPELSNDTVKYYPWHIKHVMELPDKYGNSMIAIAWAKIDTASYDEQYKAYIFSTQEAFNKILIYDNGKWDTIAVPSILKDYGLPTGNFEKMQMWGDSDDEILFSVRNGGNVVLLIYNLAAKTWRHFKLPYVGLEEHGIKFYDYAFWNGKHYFLLNRYDPMDGKEYHFGALLEYDPAKDPTSIEDETEAGAIPDLWIRKVTPNPATSSVNVNIMYYPSGIYSNDLEVGLYNYMGEKIIDLTPLGTYTEHNHTWEATFDIPKRLASGMYFLNVRSGDESRTKGIAIY